MKTNTTLWSPLLKFIALLLMCNVSSLWAWDGTGTTADPYLISTPQELDDVRTVARGNNNNFKLTADIDMVAFGDFAPIEDAGGNTFKGGIDGDGYVIKNITIKVSGDSRHKAGLILNMNQTLGYVKNLGIENITFSGADPAAAVGAIVGCLSHDNAYISNCYVKGGTIEGGKFVGGLVGTAYKGTISNCFVDATITGASVTGERLAGIAGRSTLDVSQCAFYGTITGTDIYSIAENFTTATNGTGTTVKCYYDANCGATQSDATSLTTAELLVSSNFPDFNFAGDWVMGTTYPSLTTFASATTSSITYENLIDVDNLINPEDYTDLVAVTLVKPGIKVRNKFAGWFTNETLTDTVSNPVITLGSVGDYTFYAKWDTVIMTSGTGDETDPYLIATAQELDNIRYMPTWKYYKLTADIDMSGVNWEPLANVVPATNKPYFAGTIDGDAHVISHLTIATDATVNVGFISEIRAGIKNLGIEHIDIDAPYAVSVGGIAGSVQNNDARFMTNCYVRTGTIKGKTSVGGLVGFLPAKGQYANLFADVDVSGDNKVAGLFAQFSGTEACLQNAAFYGTVTTLGAESGAIVAQFNTGASLANCHVYYDNTSTVEGVSANADATGLTTAECAVQDSYVGFDFTTEPVWKLDTRYAILSYTSNNLPTELANASQVPVSVYPNPSTGCFTLSLTECAELMVSDLSGKTLVAQSASAGDNAIDLSHYGSGIYLLTISDKGYKEVVKLIVN